MTSTQRFLANNRNVLRDAAIAATSVATIHDAVLEKPMARAGSARVALSGAYIGHDEAQYEIEIVDSTVDTPLVSQPVFAGAGSGSVGGITFTGTAQTFTVKLADLGKVLTAAGTDIEGVSIEARTPGATGNLIRLSVDLSALVYTDSDYSLIETLPVGANGVEGPQWDWDTRIMGADGLIPADAHRITFGEDTSTVYRQYKAYKNGKWRYHFEPPIASEVPAGARVKFVSGGRTVTITDGTTTETYPGIVTLYDLLSAIQTSSALVKVSGIVANDTAPGGMAARDLVTRTDAHCLPSYANGGKSATGFVNYAAMAGAKTELVEARCWAVSSKDHPNAGVGKELWQLKGSVSGVLETALKTGDPFVLSDRFQLEIPTRLPDGFGAPRGRFSLTEIALVARNASSTPPEVVPDICIKQSLALGPEAIDQTLTLVYKKRTPSVDCGCEDMYVPDLSGRKCLTGDIYSTDEGGGIMTPAQMGRFSRLGKWHREFVEGNIAITTDPTVKQEADDIRLAGLARDAFLEGLNDIYNSGVLSWPSWATNQAIDRYTIIQIGDDRMQATIGGTTGSTMPAVPVTEGGTVVDGTVTWEYIGKTPEAMWDAAMDELETMTGGLSTLSMSPAPADAPYIYNVFEPFVRNADDLFTAPEAFASTPDFTNYGNYIFKATGAGFTTQRYMRVLLPEVSVAIGDVCTVQWTKSAVLGEPYYGIWNDIGTCVVSARITSASTNNSLKFMTEAGFDGLSKRFAATMDAVRAAAGITKKADASSVSGGSCWRDTGDAYWWEITGSAGGSYAPAFTNTPYFSSRQAGKGYFPTHEFAFQINVKCDSALKHGDKIILTINDAGWPSTYQVGDTLYLPVIAAQDLFLAGGLDGDNIQTWHVDGSVDGAFPAYVLDGDAPAPYSAAGLGFSIAPGGIRFEAGDTFRFAIEGGHYRWRKVDGAWSTAAAIPAAPAALSDGLSASFATGAAPSFAAGDLYRYRALQPAALSNVVNPDMERWKWDGPGATLTASLGAIKPIDCVALAFHTLPSGAVVTLSGSADGTVWDWAEPITWRAGVMAKLFAARTAAYLKLEIASATGGAIGWAWAGQALSTEYSAECQLRRDYSIERGAGLNPSAAFLGAASSGEIEWQQGILKDADMAGLIAMLDQLKRNNDEPLILIPQHTRPEEAWLARVLLDEIEMPEDGGYQPDAGSERRYGMKLSIKGMVA